MEYLTALHVFHRTTGSNTQTGDIVLIHDDTPKTVKVGDIVLIHDDTPRVLWRLAVIEYVVNKGADGLIHSATVRTSTGRTNWPIAKLYPLEVTAAELPTSCHITEENSTTPTPQPQQHRTPRQHQPHSLSSIEHLARPPYRDVGGCNNGLTPYLPPTPPPPEDVKY